MATLAKLTTAEDLWRLPGDGRGYELIRGELTMVAPAGGGHGRAAMKIARLLDTYAEANDLGIVFAAETGFIIERDPDTVRAPDAAFVAKNRIPQSGIPAGYIPFAPDLVIEVLSPGDSQIDVEEKIQQWLSSGVRAAWVVNPRLKTITVHRPARDPRVLRESDTLAGDDVVPGFALDVAELFRPLR